MPALVIRRTRKSSIAVRGSFYLPDKMLIAGQRCLVLEDEFLIALDLQQILETAGAVRVICVSSIADALTQLSRERFTVAVVDMMIDGVPSIAVTNELLRQNIPFVFLTGMSPDAAQARGLPAAPLVGKPYQPDLVIAVLN